MVPAAGTIGIAGVVAGDSVTIGPITLIASTQQASGGLNFNYLAPTPATGTIAVSAGTIAGDLIQIGGAVLTAVAGPRTSGSNDFSIVGTPAAVAAGLSAAIKDPANNTASVAAASVLGTLITLTAVVSGPSGNFVPLSSSTAALVVSGPFLVGGTAGTDPAVAQSLAAAINDAGNGLGGFVAAVLIGSSVVQVTSVISGDASNLITLVSSTGVRLPVTGQGYLTGGFGSSSESGGQYGYSPYGSGVQPRPPIPTTGGYGGADYGLKSYGSLDITPPRVSSATSLDGFRIEIFFSEEMRADAAYHDAASYTLAPTLGAPSTVLSIQPGVTGQFGGYTSVIVVHTGTTLGGTYTVTVTGLVDVSGGNPIDALPPTNSTGLLTLGTPADFTVTPTGGDSLLVNFFKGGTGIQGGQPQPMLPETGFSPGIEDPAGYSVVTTYPVPLLIQSIAQPTPDTVALTVQGQTSASYSLVISPAVAIRYDGSILPSASTEFTGVELGTGTSVAGASLALSKVIGSTYGWAWEDTTGKLLPSSSIRTDFSFQFPTAPFTIIPSLSPLAFGTLLISDGSVQVALTLTRVASTDVIDIVSGAFSASIPVNWSSGLVSQVSLVRNQKAGLYSILFNGIPQITGPVAAFTGSPTIAPGAAFLLNPTYEVTGFLITELNLNSTQTIFTSAWNFQHNGSSVFIGSDALTRDHLLTDRGPLTKGWGDATPATEEDVEVLVNGVSVVLGTVNPYVGRIEPLIPIPLMPIGGMTVEVNYTWFPNPPLPMAGLNTIGLVLNKWDLSRGHHHPSTNPTPASSLGVADTARFPMGIALAPTIRTRPILIGHRYLGFEKDYTASLNSPTTFLLNQNPHRVSLPYLSQTPQGVSVAFEGTTTPQRAELPWVLEGTDDGLVNADGTYTLVDAQAGGATPADPNGTAALYSRAEDLSFPSSLVLAARFVVADTNTTDGIFTGVAFGAHDNRRLYLAGCLELNGVKHVGLLQNAAAPQDAASWEIGPKATITIIDSVTFQAPTTDLPNIVEIGVRFQVFEGSQTGTYEIASISVGTNGITTVGITIASPFPANPALWANDRADAFFEVLWDQTLTTYRLLIDPDAEGGSAQFFVGGSLAGLVLTVDNVEASPADTALLIQTGEDGQILWGSASREAANSSTWSFYRYGITPDATSFNTRGIVVAAEMGEKPENDANNEWFITNEFGFSEIDSSGDTLLLKSTAAWPDTSLDLSFGYARIEPLLNTTTLVDVDATFKVESGTLGSGDAHVVIFDTEREVRMGTLLYQALSGASVGSRLVFLPSQSLSGMFIPTDQNWSEVSGTSVGASARGQIITFQQIQPGTFAGWSSQLVLNEDCSGGRIIESTLAITNSTVGTDGTAGPFFGANAGWDGFGGGTVRSVAVAFRNTGTPEVVLTDSTDPEGAPTATTVRAVFPFAWDDGLPHTYRAVVSVALNRVELFIDDLFVVAADFDSFSPTPAPSDSAAFFGFYGGALPTSVVQVDAFSVTAEPVNTVRRTLGIWLGGPLGQIDSWRLPRTNYDIPNSTAPWATIIQMDWRDTIRVRLSLDPTWGVTLLRPDLPLPPWYDGDFATETTEPSAGWVNVETRQLPQQSSRQGSVSWGALDPGSVSQQRWGEVRYRVYSNATEEYLAPQNMVLNRYNVISSGELGRDITVETVEVQSVSTRLVSLRPAHMTADRVFKVIVDDVVVSAILWSFDPDTQTITLVNALPSEHYMVTVAFAPGKPVTNTYLCSQPLLNSVTLLNDSTPPYPKSQSLEAIREVVFGSKINDPNDILNDDPDFVLNDPFRTVEFRDDPTSLYEQLEFCTVDDAETDGVLSIACDGPGPGEGLIGMGLSGALFTDCFTVPGGPGGPFGGGSPVIKGSASSFPQTSILHASGGSYVDGTLGGGGAPPGAILFPNYPSGAGVIPGTGAGGSQEVRIRLDYTEPFPDTYDIAATTSDNTPPSLDARPENEPNPDGTPGATGNGACIVLIEDAAGTGSRLGPWGGTPSLEPQSYLAGGATVLPGTPFILAGGAALPPNTFTTQVIEAAN